METEATGRPTAGKFIDILRAALPSSRVLDEAGTMDAFVRDQCALARHGRPLAVVKAGSIEDVVTTVQLANEFLVPVVTRGAGTGLAGAANASDGSIVLSLESMNTLRSIDPIAQIATAEPGVINRALDNEARKYGLFYAPDPGSRDISTLGGNIATNAGGMCCAKYGVTADHLLNVRVVTGRGDLVSLGTTNRKDVAGLNLSKIVAGSEGTLGIVVEATVRLLPVPVGLVTVAATFAETKAAGECVREFRRFGTPAVMELMDATTLSAVNDYTQMGLDSTGTLLLGQFDGADATELARRFQDCAAGATELFISDDPNDGIAMMEARRAAYPALEARGSTLLDDVCVPVERVPELIDAIGRIADSRGLTIGTFGHAADGNLHPTVVFDAGNPQEVAAAHSAFRDIVMEALSLGGTVTGEHGVGSLKYDLIREQIGEAEIDLMNRVRRAFDPNGIMNPGRAY